MCRIAARLATAALLLGCVSCATAPDQRPRGLTSQDFAKVIVNKTTADQVRELLGPPARNLKSREHQGQSWGYRYRGDYEARVFWIEISTDGVARAVSDAPDFEAGKYRSP